MRCPLISATALALLLAGPILAQTATENTSEGEAAEGNAEDAATDSATTTEQAAPPPPEYNGTISGSSSGSPVNAEVVCTGFEAGGGVTVQSDPGGGMQDLNGDGIMADITADPSGFIALTLLAGNTQVGLTDTTAKISDNTLTYSITMTFTGGASDTVDISVTCNE